jgi:hypothetical protein
MFWWVFFCNGPFDWPITKKLWNPHFTHKFTLFYIYIILHDHIKSYKCICFTLTLFYVAA